MGICGADLDGAGRLRARQHPLEPLGHLFEFDAVLRHPDPRRKLVDEGQPLADVGRQALRAGDVERDQLVPSHPRKRRLRLVEGRRAKRSELRAPVVLCAGAGVRQGRRSAGRPAEPAQFLEVEGDLRLLLGPAPLRPS